MALNLPPGADLSQIPSGYPPTGVAPNFVNPTTLGPTVIGINITFIALATIAVLGRLVANFTSKRRSGPDDCWWPPQYHVRKSSRLTGIGCCGFGLLGAYVYSGFAIASA